MARRSEIVSHLEELLDHARIADYSKNGLQFEGTEEVSRVGLAVDGCLKAYQNAVAAGCQMVISHHGFIWGGLDSITGPIRRQVQYLVEHNLNVYVSHLPLDLHAEYGNNIELARILGLDNIRAFGNYKGTHIGFAGDLTAPMSTEAVSDVFQASLGGTSQLLTFGPDANRSVAIISGGGSEAIHEAAAAGYDCFVTGESSQWNHHAALEAGLNVIYLGHYHSETVGVKALGRHLEEKFGVETEFLDEPTLT
jgi:dinuclear metal center YbgI/SA1388 family protein